MPGSPLSGRLKTATTYMAQIGENYDRLVGQKSGLAAIGEAVGMPYYDGHGGFTK